MKFYVWEDVLYDWTGGMIVIAARNDDEAARMLREKFEPKEWMIGYHISAENPLRFDGVEPIIIDPTDPESNPQIFSVWGGS